VTSAERGYYSRPVLKEPVWTPEVAVYFFTGGLAGASAGLAFVARLAGNPVLARRALLGALAGLAASPPLLVIDLGRPERFLHMLRVFKPTSPMSIGTWVLTAFGGALGGAAVAEFLGLFRPLGRGAEAAAALLGLPLSTYTAVLVADTSVPVWHHARRHLPFVFAGSAGATGGGLAAALTPAEHAGPARRLAVLSGLTELTAALLMERHLGSAARPYESGRAARPARVAKACTAAGAALMLLTGRRRPGAIAAGGLLMAGSLAERFAVLYAGRDSARTTIGEETVHSGRRAV
jgi:formate-dependent nitrite reductase membrane component NrfD